MLRDRPRTLGQRTCLSEGVQRGFLSSANEFVEFGRHQSAIGHFHAVLAECLAAYSMQSR